VDQAKFNSHYSTMPQVGWLLANVLCFSTVTGNYGIPGNFTQDLDYDSYVQVVIILSENLLTWLDDSGWVRKESQQFQVQSESSGEPVDSQSLKVSYIDFYKPVYQQWHLVKLLALAKGGFGCGVGNPLSNNLDSLRKCDLLDVAYYYSYMIRIFSLLNPVVGCLPVLNVLSFTPGFLANLWEALERLMFPGKNHLNVDNYLSPNRDYGNKNDGVGERKQKQLPKDGANKWSAVLHKIRGKADIDNKGSIEGQPKYKQVDEDSSDVWDIEPMRHGPESISKDMSCLLHLFCASYSHLLLVLDDIEFYEKQVSWHRLA